MAVDESKKISFFHGKKDGIQAKIDDGTITGSDLVITSDSDEIVFVDTDKAQHTLGNAKSKEAHVANLGTGGSVGGIKDGDTIDADTDIDTLIKKIITKQVLPTYTSPKITLARTSGDAPGKYEVGSTIKTTLTATFTQNDAGALTAIAINDGSNDILTGTASPLTATDHEFTLGTSNVVFKATATYGDGAAKQDNLGEDDTEHIIKGGTITSSTLTYQAVRNGFYGVGSGSLPELTSAFVRGLGNSVTGPSAGTSFSISIPVGSQYVAFAYPATLRDVNQVMYVEQNDTGMAASFTKTTVQVEGANSAAGVDYKVYTYTMAAPSEATMTFKVTI